MAAPQLVAALVATPFIATIVLDALRGRSSNLARMVSASGFQWHEPADVATYMLGFLSYDAPAGVVSVEPRLRLSFIASHLLPFAIVLALIALPVVMVLRRGPFGDRLRELRDPLGSYWAVVWIAAALAVTWTAVQRGDLFGFNSFFFFGLFFAALLPAAMVLSLVLHDRAVTAAVPLLALGSIGLALILPPPAIPSDSQSAREVHATLPGVLAVTDPGRPIFLDLDHLPVWFPAGALALELERSGRSFEVADGGPALLFGYERITKPGQVPAPIRWVLVDPSQTDGYTYRLSEDLAIAMP
jgi:hypothetical protein